MDEKIIEKPTVTYKDGNTTIIIVYPKISEEENQRRWDKINRTANQIVQNMITRNEI